VAFLFKKIPYFYLCMFKQFALLVFLLAAFAGSSQSISKNMRLARMAVDKGDFATAANEYKKALAQDSNHFYANLEYGLLLFEYMNESAGAGKYLLKAEKNSKKDTMPELLLGIAKYYHYLGDMQNAITYYHRFYRYIDLKDKDGILLEKEVSGYIANCKYTLSDAGQVNRKRLKVINAGPGINTVFPEYVPVPSQDKKTLMFTSRRRIADKSKIDFENGGFYEDMYMAHQDKDGFFKDPKPFSLQTPKLPGTAHKHESAISVSYVGDRFYTFFDGKIYESVRQGNDWSNPAVLNANLNHENEFKNHVCISKDGKTLYYSAERVDGFGGLDLYKSVQDADGKWQPGTNMGNAINTKADEGGPLMSEDGASLYFSSKGHPGYGGYDFFKTTFEGNNWSAPRNLGRPYNGPGDDIYLSINNDETAGYFSSSRAGGFGDMDIYEIRLVKPFEEFTIDPLARAVILLPDTVYLNDTIALKAGQKEGSPVFSEYYWQVNDSVMVQKNASLSFSFTKPGPTRIRLEAITENEDIIGAEKTIFVSEKIISVASNTITTAIPEATNLEPVYFDLNKADINEVATRVLDANLEKLGNLKGGAIEILAYADARGSVAYNRSLSQRRARAVVNYLKKKGFNARLVKRITPLGEYEPVNRCADGVECSEEEYQLNRRVEIRMVEVKK